MSMTPQELRIGNWVSFEGKYFQIYCVSKDQPFLDTIEFGVGVVTYEDIKPILLSPDILLKMGFEKTILDKNSEIKEYYYSLQLSNDKYEDLSLIDSGQNDTFEVYLFPFESIRFQYVHQLQNIFYSLTGKELIINL